MGLSKRMECLIQLVPKGYRLADVGCDHGFVSIALLERGICSLVIASDVKPGPLDRAKEHIARRGLDKEIQVRLSNGLEHLSYGEVDGCLIAGMGGPLMQDIILASMDKAKKMTFLVLQPQSEISSFREFLLEQGFCILRNEVLVEDGKYYFPMLVAPLNSPLLQTVDRWKIMYPGQLAPIEDQDIFLRYGLDLLSEDRGMASYLQWEAAKLQEIIANLSILPGDYEKRIGELKQELAWNQRALTFMKNSNRQSCSKTES